MRILKQRRGAMMLLEATLVLVLMAAIATSIAELNMVRKVDAVSETTRLEARLIASAQADVLFAKYYNHVVNQKLQRADGYPDYQYRIEVGSETATKGMRSKPVAIFIARSDNPALTVYKLNTRVSTYGH